LTVISLMPSSNAICLFSRPFTTSRKNFAFAGRQLCVAVDVLLDELGRIPL